MRQLFKDYEVLGPGLIHHWLPCSSACRRPIVGLRLVILTGGQGAGMAGAVNSERPELAKSTAEVQIQQPDWAITVAGDDGRYASCNSRR
ncbi:hypothetical protein CK820_G0040642 [Pan troglodytes]|uniref:Uncharacterized protein n=1 Tax=Pan troglodytes TaxID=9598 RepID=A0A2J8K8Y4_PANTR|nr:hypothetical protein CK820_G0040642 [Pan troglodytes]